MSGFSLSEWWLHGIVPDRAAAQEKTLISKEESMRAALIIAAAVLLAACAGTPFTFGQASKVKVGMSEDQLYEIMGNPYMTVSKEDSQSWIYTHATAFSGAKSISFETKDGVVSKVPYIPKDFLPSSNPVE
jgi:hypothetical protein